MIGEPCLLVDLFVLGLGNDPIVRHILISEENTVLFVASRNRLPEFGLKRATLSPAAS